MRRILFLYGLFLVNILFSNDVIASNPTNVDKEWETFINAIIWVESRGNDKIVSNDGKCVGCLQIKKILVDDCNNILGKKKYTYNDRYNRTKSIEMFNIIQKRYNPTLDFYKATIAWNSGIKYLSEKERKNASPSRKQKIQTYYNNVMQRYNKLIGD